MTQEQVENLIIFLLATSRQFMQFIALRKTKYMFATSRELRRIDSRITADNYTFSTVKELIYLSSAVTIKNDVSLEIKRRITFGNRCCYGLNRQLSSTDLSRTTKLTRHSFYPCFLMVQMHGPY